MDKHITKGILPIVRRYQRRLRHIRELQKMVDEMEKSEPSWKNHPTAQRNREMIKVDFKQFCNVFVMYLALYHWIGKKKFHSFWYSIIFL